VLTDKVDMANVRLELENGAVANLTASRVSQDRVRKQRFFGRDFYLSVDTKDQDVKGYRLVSEGDLKAVKPFEVSVEKKEPLRAELEAFVACVRDRQRPLVTGEDGLEAVALATRVAAAIDASLQKGRG
jgi:predicted dehydrogenase